MPRFFFNEPPIDKKTQDDPEYQEQLGLQVEAILDGEPAEIQVEVKKLAKLKIQNEGMDPKEAEKKATEELEKIILAKITELQKQINKTGKPAKKTAEKINKLKEALGMDELTELINQKGFERRMIQNLINYERYEQEGAEIGIITMDINDFKDINDTDGHLDGNRILIELSRILETSVRQNDFVARFGGDEFVVGMTHLPRDSEELSKTLSRLQNEIAKNLKRQDGRPVKVSMGAFSTGDITKKEWTGLDEKVKERRLKPDKQADKVYRYLFNQSDSVLEVVKVLHENENLEEGEAKPLELDNDNPAKNNAGVFDEIKNIDTDTEDFFVLSKLRKAKRDLNDIKRVDGDDVWKEKRKEIVERAKREYQQTH